MELLPDVRGGRIWNYGRLSEHQQLMALQRLISEVRARRPTKAMLGNARRRELLTMVRTRTEVRFFCVFCEVSVRAPLACAHCLDSMAIGSPF